MAWGLVLVATFVLCMPCHGLPATATAALAWDPSPDPEVAGYIVHYGRNPGSYTRHLDVGNVTFCDVGDLSFSDTYYFAVTAYNFWRMQSPYSNELIWSADTSAQTITLSEVPDLKLFMNSGPTRVQIVVGGVKLESEGLLEVSVQTVQTNLFQELRVNRPAGKTTGNVFVLTLNPAAGMIGAATITIKASLSADYSEDVSRFFKVDIIRDPGKQPFYDPEQGEEFGPDLDFLQFHQITCGPDGSMLLIWASKPEGRYQILYKEDMGEAGWKPLVPVYEASTGISYHRDITMKGREARYYLIQRVSEPRAGANKGG